MATTTASINFEAYLATNYRPDHEWINGELRERNLGSFEHARLQALLANWMIQNESAWGVLVATEARMLVAAQRVRIPDLVVVSNSKQPAVLTEPPILVIEILSPDHTCSDTQERAQDYLNMGVPAVWIIDPKTRTGRLCSGAIWELATELKVPESPIHVDLSMLFSKLD